jgi:molybdopterin-guanine dinucleotide biosynthesis protein A
MQTGGLLLTGGTGSRLGRDKALLPVDGMPSAARLAAVLSEVVAPVVEVGPGRSGLPAVADEGEGPLAAVAAGVAWLRASGFEGGAVVLACDLPFVDEALVGFLAAYPGTAVPMVARRAQPLCARYSAAALDAVAGLVAAGERRMSALLEVGPVSWLDESRWSAVATARHFADIDTPADAAALGIPLP